MGLEDRWKIQNKKQHLILHASRSLSSEKCIQFDLTNRVAASLKRFISKVGGQFYEHIFCAYPRISSLSRNRWPHGCSVMFYPWWMIICFHQGGGQWAIGTNKSMLQPCCTDWQWNGECHIAIMGNGEREGETRDIRHSNREAKYRNLFWQNRLNRLRREEYSVLGSFFFSSSTSSVTKCMSALTRVWQSGDTAVTTQTFLCVCSIFLVLHGWRKQWLTIKWALKIKWPSKITSRWKAAFRQGQSCFVVCFVFSDQKID